MNVNVRISRRNAAAVSALGLLGMGLTPLTALAQPAGKFEEGLDYIALDQPVQTEAGRNGTDARLRNKIEVVEFFWYDCPHCNLFEPRLERWVQTAPPYVHFRRVPVAFRESFVPQQQLYYTLEALGQVGQLHAAIFRAIHEGKQNLSTREGILAWIAKQNLKTLNQKKFAATYDSFSVASKTSRATLLQTAYRVGGVPALGIAGKYYVDGQSAQSMDRALQVVNMLVAQVRGSAAKHRSDR